MNTAKIIKLAIREANKSEEPGPNTASIYLMCECYNRPEYFNQIVNRIAREVEQFPDLLEHIAINPAHITDIWLDGDGVCVLSDILTGYFPNEDIVSLYRYLRINDKKQKNEYNMFQSLRSHSKEELTTLLRDIESKDVPTEQQPGKDRAIKLLQDETGKRKGIFRIK